ncbi:MAG TPA: SusD/RagB family nutrient-binding outer membrane lipoprotein [Sphingobacteriaceae bacterium]|nr:SusD/RagB family nutrient-binding outer membrane lipoprotein [Sphingobacteriaceae bacterium]
MRNSIINNKYKLISLSLLLFVTSSCKDDLEGLNNDLKQMPPSALAQDANEGGFLLPTIMHSVVGTTTGVQTQQNLQAESYANYLEAPSNFIGNVNPTTYVTRGIWPNSYNTSTNGVMNNWLQMKKTGIDVKYPDLYAIALILKVAAGGRLVDTFGPYPYTTYGSSAEPKFDTPQEAYAAFFKDLDQAVAALKAAETADPNADQARFKKWDVSSMGGEYTKWIKIANTLRLRLAIRISGTPDAALAKTEGEKAMAATSGGVLTDVEGSWSVAATSGINPYFTFTNAWSDTRVSAAVITYLQGFGDPRLPVYALPGTDPVLAGTYRGIRPGVERPTKTVYENYSKYNVKELTPVKQMDGAESYFLRAEGALLGWAMGGTPQALYEAGVRASLKLNGVPEGTYLQSTSMQMDYVDPKKAAYNSPRLSDVTVKWNEAATAEQKLEKIITQKWITVFPEGTEAWSEFRRTGYPKLYNIMDPKNPKLPLGTFIKRLTYPVIVASSSKAAYDAAVSGSLGGRDDEDVKFYWMK